MFVAFAIKGGKVGIARLFAKLVGDLTIYNFETAKVSSALRLPGPQRIGISLELSSHIGLNIANRKFVCLFVCLFVCVFVCCVCVCFPGWHLCSKLDVQIIHFNKMQVLLVGRDCRDHSKYVFLWNWLLYPQLLFSRIKSKFDAMKVCSTFIFAAKTQLDAQRLFSH